MFLETSSLELFEIFLKLYKKILISLLLIIIIITDYDIILYLIYELVLNRLSKLKTPQT